jgi:putative ABC transport system permease protein
MNLSFFLETLRLAVTNLHLHKLRSALTSLGIIIGVGAVITMLAIGEGAKQKTLRDVNQLGATNIILRSVPPTESNQVSNQRNQLLVYGLKRSDLDLIRTQAAKGIIPGVEMIVPLRDAGKDVTRDENKCPTAAAVATTPEFLAVANLTIASGRFLTNDDMDNDRTVCVLGASVAQQLFNGRTPLNQPVSISGPGDRTAKIFQVVGVLDPVGLAGGKGSALTGRDLNFDVYFPLTTNAALFSDNIVKLTAGGRERKTLELSEIYLRARSASLVEPTAAALQRLMDLVHSQQSDVKLFVPRELLNQANQANLMFNLVMGGIAVLSLLIGGIGIMNISLATVTERTREIGIRRALGGKRKHIVSQFLIETTTLSLAGGLLGIGAGVGLALVIQFSAGDAFPTAVTLWSVVLSFSISVLVGIIFGVYPAYVAAHKDPIEALRHD